MTKLFQILHDKNFFTNYWLSENGGGMHRSPLFSYGSDSLMKTFCHFNIVFSGLKLKLYFLDFFLIFSIMTMIHQQNTSTLFTQNHQFPPEVEPLATLMQRCFEGFGHSHVQRLIFVSYN